MRAAFAATICYRPHDYVILNMILNFHYQFITALVNPLLKLAHWRMNGWTDMEYDSTSISFEIHWCMLKVSLIKDYSYNKIWFSRLLIRFFMFYKNLQFRSFYIPTEEHTFWNEWDMQYSCQNMNYCLEEPKRFYLLWFGDLMGTNCATGSKSIFLNEH